MKVKDCESIHVRWCTLSMAALATILLEQAVLEPGQSKVIALISTIACYVIPTIIASWYLGRSGGSSSGSRRISGPAVFVGLVVLSALPFAREGVRLAVSGRSIMPEIVLLSALRNIGLGLAVAAYRGPCARLSALVSLFVVTVASPMGGGTGPGVIAPVMGFAIVGTFWLMLVYWDRLGPIAGPGERSSRLPLSGIAWILGIVAIPGAVMVVGPSRAATTLVGFMPTSGGTDWSDPDARSGVGDGDNEVGASENPQSVGFTESEIYLETDRPSLYDAFNESYGEPLKPKKREKMVALGPQGVGEQKERPAENLQAGREFSAVRRKPEPRGRRPGERAARALVYVKGPTPLHLALTSYSHFDGTGWQEEPCCSRDLGVERETGETWLRLPRLVTASLTGIVSHQIKVGTLDSSPMPLPAHVQRFRVGSVDRPDFFGWAQFGIIRMTDRTVPAGTVIDSEAMTVDPDRLAATLFPARPRDDRDHNLSFQGTYSPDLAVYDLARRWVAEVPEGWPQVKAVIGALRRDFIHDRFAQVPTDCGDVVADFLLRSRRGPDYLFASSAAVLLQAIGYPTRVISGLYASPARYDPRTRHTPVIGEDVHFWAEVRLPSGVWVAVEPTPGYDLLPPVLPWTERLARALALVGSWFQRHPIGLSCLCAGLVFLVVRRRELVDRASLIVFRFTPSRDERHLVLRALCLIERRARWAGCARPPGSTLRRWYQPVTERFDGRTAETLRDLIRLADWAIHAPGRSTSRIRGVTSNIENTCRRAVRDLTIARFQEAARGFAREGATT